MERKSIGTFIAALRRANGMTQKDLAEKLSVSDKAVSRWERDESLPDLMLLPVIADIFHITVDELLRGERKMENCNGSTETKEDTEAEITRLKKQTKRILALQINRLRNRNCVALVVGAIGLMEAIVCNFAFAQGFVAFCIGFVCIAVAAILCALFCQAAWQTADEEEYDAEAVKGYKQAVVLWMKRMTSILLGMLALCLPMGLTILNSTSYRNVYIEPGNWLRYGAVCFATLEVMLSLGIWQVNKRWLAGKGLVPDEHRVELHGWCIGALCAVMALTLFFLAVAPEPAEIARQREETFDSADTFVQEMERRWEEEKQRGDALYGTPTRVEYFDGYGNPIPEEEATLHRLYDNEGNVIAQYHRPSDVMGVRRTTYSDGRTVIGICSEQDYRNAVLIRENRINLCIFLYALEPLLALAAYQIIIPEKRKEDKK